MKWLGKKILSVIGLALVITLAAALYPYIRQMVREWLPQGKYDRATMLISHEMEKAGELTAVRYTDQAVMEASTKALLIGEVQNVKAPYSYEIGLGIRLADVQLTAGDAGITVAVPDVEMLYDSFRVTGSPEVQDFLYKLSESRYQKMIDDQAAACRTRYLGDAECLNAAWDAACETLKSLIGQWTGETIPLQFRHL